MCYGRRQKVGEAETKKQEVTESDNNGQKVKVKKGFFVVDFETNFKQSMNSGFVYHYLHFSFVIFGCFSHQLSVGVIFASCRIDW